MIMFPLGSKYLLRTALPVLLLFYLAALRAAVLVSDAVDASSLFAGPVSVANTTLNIMAFILFSIQGFAPVRSDLIMSLPARVWVLIYWLLMQTAVFWSVCLVSAVWEGRARAKFLPNSGERPAASLDLLQIFKLCVLVQGAVAGLALGCILHKPLVAYISML
jgi:hypothetical protein